MPEVNGTAGTHTEVAADTAPEIPAGPDPALKAKEVPIISMRVGTGTMWLDVKDV